jgi:hypothetical protein
MMGLVMGVLLSKGSAWVVLARRPERAGWWSRRVEDVRHHRPRRFAKVEEHEDLQEDRAKIGVGRDVPRHVFKAATLDRAVTPPSNRHEAQSSFAE